MHKMATLRQKVRRKYIPLTRNAVEDAKMTTLRRKWRKCIASQHQERENGDRSSEIRPIMRTVHLKFNLCMWSGAQRISVRRSRLTSYFLASGKGFLHANINF